MIKKFFSFLGFLLWPDAFRRLQHVKACQARLEEAEFYERMDRDELLRAVGVFVRDTGKEGATAQASALQSDIAWYWEKWQSAVRAVETAKGDLLRRPEGT